MEENEPRNPRQGNRPLSAGPKVVLMSTLEESQFPSEGPLGAPLGTPSSQVRAEGSRQGGAAPHDPRPEVASAAWALVAQRTPPLALQGPWGEWPGCRKSIFETLVD